MDRSRLIAGSAEAGDVELAGRARGQSSNSFDLANHDQPRPGSRFSDASRYRVSSTKLLAAFLHLLQGTPYICQGAEAGMINVAIPSIDD